AADDTILRTIKVVPDGFPFVGSISDMIEKRARGTITLPKDVVAGSLKVRLEVYPTSMADLVKGLDGLLREPGGCFEQTSTSNYPNTMILDYMNQTNQANPDAAKRAKGMLERGYAKLVSFECPDTPAKTKQGFEWFGGADQQHEALTAYGLLQFKDMARVTPVDPELIKRTQAFRSEDEAGVRVGRRGRPAARGADRLRPVAVQGHGPGHAGRSGTHQADAGVPALPQGRQRRVQAERPGARQLRRRPQAHHRRLHRLGTGRERPGRRREDGPAQGDRRAEGRGAQREL